MYPTSKFSDEEITLKRLFCIPITNATCIQIKELYGRHYIVFDTVELSTLLKTLFPNTKKFFRDVQEMLEVHAEKIYKDKTIAIVLHSEKRRSYYNASFGLIFIEN